MHDLYRNDHGFRALVANVRSGYETTLRSGPLESLAQTVHEQPCVLVFPNLVLLFASSCCVMYAGSEIL